MTMEAEIRINDIDTVIFDLDGLLIDSERSFYDMDERFLKHFGHSFSLEDYVRFHCGKTIIDNITLFIQKYALPITLDEGLIMINEEIEKETQKGIPLKKGAKELLDYLKINGYKIVLATSSVKDRALTILEKDGVLDYFDACVFGNEVKAGKPHPDVFLKAADKVNADPDTCLVLEDSEAGIKAAHNAGMRVICIPDLKEPDHDHIILTSAILHSLDEVITYLKRRR